MTEKTQSSDAFARVMTRVSRAHFEVFPTHFGNKRAPDSKCARLVSEHKCVTESASFPKTYLQFVGIITRNINLLQWIWFSGFS